MQPFPLVPCSHPFSAALVAFLIAATKHLANYSLRKEVFMVFIVHLRVEGLVAGAHMRKLVSLCLVGKKRDMSGGV